MMHLILPLKKRHIIEHILLIQFVFASVQFIFCLLYKVKSVDVNWSKLNLPEIKVSVVTFKSGRYCKDFRDTLSTLSYALISITRPYLSWMEANAVTQIHPKISNEAGFGHRWTRLVTYATWISLLRSHDNAEISECHKWLQKQRFRVYNPSSVKTVKLTIKLDLWSRYQQTHETKVVTKFTLYATNCQKLCNGYSLDRGWYIPWTEDAWYITKQ